MGRYYIHDGNAPLPSIEEKIDRFSERDRHQIFVEPEGWNTVEIYVKLKTSRSINLSTS